MKILTTENSSFSLEFNHLCDYVEVPGVNSAIKVTGVLVVPFRGLNLWIGTA